jgi:hypothetical protein
MSMGEKFPAQKGRAGASENAAIPLDLNTERPTSPADNIFPVMCGRCVALGTEAVELVSQRVPKEPRDRNTPSFEGRTPPGGVGRPVEGRAAQIFLSQ